MTVACGWAARLEPWSRAGVKVLGSQLASLGAQTLFRKPVFMHEDLASRLRDAIMARRTLAEAAAVWAPSPWRYGSLNLQLDAVIDDAGNGALIFAHHYEPVADVVRFVETNNPDVVRARCDLDLKMLQRHQLRTWRPDEYLPESLEHLRHQPFCRNCRWTQWPCPDILGLATVYGVAKEECEDE